MADQIVYTIVVKKDRIEVNKEIYDAYHKLREVERYQRKVIYQNEMSLERFQEEGVCVECRCGNRRYQAGADDEVIRLQEMRELYQALNMLEKGERDLIEQLFFEEVNERELASRLGISQAAVNKRKARLLEKLRGMLE